MPAKVESAAALPGLSPVGGKSVIARFDGGPLSSDGGLLVLREVERRLDVAGRLAACIADPRDPERVVHGLDEIIRFRLLMIAAGYEDGNDADRLRTDPVFKLALERLGEREALCSQPTISRLENLPDTRALLRMGRAMVDLYCASFRQVPRRIVLDVDDTFDTVHGGQQLRLFNAHHDEYGFQPIVVFDGEGRFVTAVLRPAKRPSGREIRAFLMVFKLVMAAAKTWRRLKGENQLPKSLPPDLIPTVVTRVRNDLPIFLFPELLSHSVGIGWSCMIEAALGRFGDIYLTADPLPSISQGGLMNLLRRAQGWFQAGREHAVAALRRAAVVASDEARVRIVGSNACYWVFRCTEAFVHDGHRPEVWLSDRYSAQQDHGLIQQTCLAHLARDVAYALEASDDPVPFWLTSAFALADDIMHLAASTVAAKRRALERRLAAQHAERAERADSYATRPTLTSHPGTN